MNWKTVMSLAVAVVMGLGAVWVGRNVVHNNGGVGVMSGNMTLVSAAATDLEPGHMLEATDLATLEIPTTNVGTTMFTDTKRLIGRTIISPVVKGQVMFDGLLAPEGSVGGLAALVPAGMRAVVIDVGEQSGVSNLLVPGCRVDVIGTLRNDKGEMARTIVSNVKVLSVGNRNSSAPKSDKVEDLRSGGGAISGMPARTATLIVTSKDAEALELASGSGRLRLVLRSQNDNVAADSKGINISQLSGQDQAQPVEKPSGPTTFDKILAAMAEAQKRTAQQKPAVPEPERHQIKIIKGGHEDTVTYEKKGSKDWAVSGDDRSAGPTTAPTNDPFK